jgi:alpha-galactosidase
MRSLLRSSNRWAAAVALLVVVVGSAGVTAAQQIAAVKPRAGKLLVFILAGQSNMQGHAEVSTLAYLSKPPYVPSEAEWATLTENVEREVRLQREASIREELLQDPVHQKLGKKELAELVQKMLKVEVEKLRAARYEEFRKRQTDPSRLARDQELAAIFTPQLTDQKVIDIAASARTIQGALERACEWESGTQIPVGKRSFIAAYGGVQRGTEPGLAAGPLSIGYGARPTAFGPEYAFGIMLERSLDQPILIIKTAWGGKSLHYDFRPPSAGSYQPTQDETARLNHWKTKKAAWDKYLAEGGTAAAMEQIDKEIKSIEREKRTLQAALAKLAKDQHASQQEKIDSLNRRSSELRRSLVPPPGDMPAWDKAGLYWNEMIGFVRKVLADPGAYHPDYDPQAGFEVAGGVWFQGFNDQFDAEYYGNYRNNMVHFIQDLRKEVNQPRMPFVIGVLGTGAFPEAAMANHVANAQREAARAPELAGTVAAVESWPLTTPEVALWRMKRDAAQADGDAAQLAQAEEQWRLHGSNLGYHYDGSGRFFIRLGDAFATAMMNLMNHAPARPAPATTP